MAVGCSSTWVSLPFSSVVMEGSVSGKICGRKVSSADAGGFFMVPHILARLLGSTVGGALPAPALQDV